MSARSFRELLEDAGYETRSYSGRGMYGKACLGVDIGRGGIGPVIAAVLREAGEGDLDTLADAFQRMSQDSMGLGAIVYFPGVPYEDEAEDDDEGDDEDADAANEADARRST